MSKMADLALDIEEALCAGYEIGDIAIRFGVTVRDVLFIEETMVDDSYDDSMDGDFDSAMASAGYGTDEDYGCYESY